MVIGRTLQKALENFFKSPVVQDSRCQVLLPNGEFYDITGAKLLENKIIGSKRYNPEIPVINGISKINPPQAFLEVVRIKVTVINVRNAKVINLLKKFL